MTEKRIEPHLVVEYNSKKGMDKGKVWSPLTDYHIASDSAEQNAMWVGTIIKSFIETVNNNANLYVRIRYYERTMMALSNGDTRIREQNETVVAGASCKGEDEVEFFSDEDDDGWYELNVLLPMSDELKAKCPQKEKESLLRAAVEAVMTKAFVEENAEAKPPATPEEEDEEEVETISPGDTIVAYDSQGNAIEFSIPE